MPVIPKGWTYLEKRNPAANESKFWACRFEPTTKRNVPALHIWWGRIGTKGQDRVFDLYATDEECIQDTRKRAEAKLREGYVPKTGALDWWPEFMKLADREPTLMAQGFGSEEKKPLAGEWNGDGEDWPIRNGRPVRPPDGRRRLPLERFSEVMDEARLRVAEQDRARAAEAVRPLLLARAPERVRGFDLAGRERDRTVVTIVSIANERVIDFED